MWLVCGIIFINVKIKVSYLYVIYSSNYFKRMLFPLMISPGVRSCAPLLCSLSFTHWSHWHIKWIKLKGAHLSLSLFLNSFDIDGQKGHNLKKITLTRPALKNGNLQINMVRVIAVMTIFLGHWGHSAFGPCCSCNHKSNPQTQNGNEVMRADLYNTAATGVSYLKYG